MSKSLVSLLNSTTLQQAMATDKQTEQEGEWKDWLQRQIYGVYNNQIQTPHKLFNYCSNIHNITFFYVQEEQILNYKKELAEWFVIAVAIAGTGTYCFKPLNSKAIKTAVTFLSTSFTTHQTNKLNSTDILVFQMIMISSYIACEYDGYWWLGIVQNKTRPYVLHKIWAASWTKFKLLLASEGRMLLD
jgi:hypothetical protein